MCKTSWGRCVSITDSVLSVGFVPVRKTGRFSKTDQIACEVLEKMAKTAPIEIQQQMQDNIKWIQEAQKNKLVVGSQARILYADAEGRMKIAEAFNKAIAKMKLAISF
jgi:urocanate hydratase